jgi:hypothetical protein
VKILYWSDQNAKKLEIVNRRAAELYQEAADVLTY